LQQFDIGIKGKGTFYSSLGFGTKGILVVFSFSSLTDFPGIEVSGQALTDRLNSWRAPVTLVHSFSNENTFRFGDYSAEAVDPSSPDRVWVEATYEGTGGPVNWATGIANRLLRENRIDWCGFLPHLPHLLSPA
jgi:hypothetical protein